MFLKSVTLAVGLLFCLCLSEVGSTRDNVASTAVCSVREERVPYWRQTVEVSQDEDRAVLAFETLPDYSRITFQVPLDCQAKVVVPKTLEEFKTQLAAGLPTDGAIQLAKYFDLMPGWDRRSDIAEDEIEGLERFLIERFQLQEGSTRKKIECARTSSNYPDLTLLLIIAVAKKLDDEDSDLITTASARRLVALSQRIVDQCDERELPRLP